jgi:organic radical activating enzyme
VVCTGGEPLLQLDESLIEALPTRGFEIAVETNGTLPAPLGVDWLCVSPKAGAELRQKSGDELKLVYPQAGVEPSDFDSLPFEQFYLQPMDGPRRSINTDLAIMAQMERSQGSLAGAISDLNQAAQICERDNYSRATIEVKIALADIYRAAGELQKAEPPLVSAAEAAQRNGEIYTLPERLKILAETQERQGKFAEADRTYDRASAFVDASIGNDSAVLDKTAWVKSVSDLYVAHVALIAEHLNNPEKVYAAVEQVRGRVITDLLLGGSPPADVTA